MNRYVFSALGLALCGTAVAATVTPIDLSDLHNPNAIKPLHSIHGMLPPSSELESDEPGNRPAHFAVDHYLLDVGVEPKTGAVDGTVTVQLHSLVPMLGEVLLDAESMQIVSVTGAPGQALTYGYDGHLLDVTLPAVIRAGESAAITVAYKSLLPQVVYTVGGDVTNPQRMPAAYSYTEPNGASAWFPCLDRPTAKATADIRVRVPQGYNALSNGDFLGMTQVQGQQAYQYRMERPIATYLMSLNVGQYQVVELGNFKGKPVRAWAAPAIADQMAVTTRRTARMIADYSAFIGYDYPFNTYTMSVAQAYHVSMEHQTATTMGGWRVTGDGTGESVVAHELGHQWFGDNVTCRNWGELWLNEGFATYLPFVFFAAEGEIDAALAERDSWRSSYFTEAKLRAHPLSMANPDYADLFDGHAYEKGALVIHYLRSIAEATPAGALSMTNALREYQAVNAGATATSEELQAALEHATGQSFQDTFDQWVRSAGHPVLALTPSFKDGVLTVALEQTQATRATNPWRTFSFPLTLEVVKADGSTVAATFDVYDDHQTFTLPLAAAPLGLSVDPEWKLPAETTVTQDLAAWRAVLAHSQAVPARLTAARTLLTLEGGVASPATVTALRAEPSVYARVALLPALTAKTENADAVRALAGDLAKTDGLGDDTRAAIARANAWLVVSAPTPPSTDALKAWQDEYLASNLVAQRTSDLAMMAAADLAKAQDFALARLAEPKWVTQDRGALIDILTKKPSDKTLPFVTSLLTDGSFTYQGYALGNLAAAGYDRPELLELLIKGATTHRYVEARPAFIKLLGKQATSKAAACPVLATLAADGHADDSLDDVRGAAVTAEKDLACSP